MSETQVEVPIPSPVAEPTEGQAATSKTGTAPTVTPLPLISSSPANQATAGAAWDSFGRDSDYRMLGSKHGPSRHARQRRSGADRSHRYGTTLSRHNLWYEEYRRLE